MRNRDRVLTMAELGKLWEIGPQIGQGDGQIVKLLILSRARRSEIIDLRWRGIDLEAALITLPAVRVKNNGQHQICLAPAAAEIIKNVTRIDDDRVWPRISWSDLIARRERIGPRRSRSTRICAS